MKQMMASHGITIDTYSSDSNSDEDELTENEEIGNKLDVDSKKGMSVKES